MFYKGGGLVNKCATAYIRKEKNIMKFCEKCGTKISDETSICPQCQTPINNQVAQKQPSKNSTKENSPKKKVNKINVVIVIFLVINIILSATNTYFILYNDKNDSVIEVSNDAITKDDSNNIFETDITTPCPEDKNGIHNWQPATCIEPSKCKYCGTYRNNNLAAHHEWYDYDSGRKCEHCGLSYEDYAKS